MSAHDFRDCCHCCSLALSLEAERDALKVENEKLRVLVAGASKQIGGAVLAVLEDNGLGDYATALANFRDRAHGLLGEKDGGK